MDRRGSLAVLRRTVFPLLLTFQTGNELVMFCERVRQDEIFHRQFLRIQSLDSR